MAGPRNTKNSKAAAEKSTETTPEADPNATVTIKQSTLDKYKTKMQELADLRKGYAVLDNNHAKLTERLNKVNAAKEVATEELKALRKTHAELERTYARVTAEMRKEGKYLESELNQEIIDKVSFVCKTILFRTVKFIEDDEDLEETTASILPHLPQEAKDDPEFVPKYKSTVLKAIRLGRQAVQSECKKKAEMLWKVTEELPTVEELTEVLGKPLDHLQDDANQADRALYLWYYDQYLPAVAGKEYWGPKIRWYKLLVDKMDVDGEQKVILTVTSEAFGLLIYENCREKWLKIFEAKKKDPDFEIPRSKDEGAEEYYAKWSDANAGNVKFGGWHEDAFARFDEFKGWVLKFRQTEKKADNVGFKYARDLMKAAHNVTEDAPTARKTRKRTKKSDSSKTTKAAPRKIRRIEE